MSWILSPVMQCLLVEAALALALYLICTVKIRTRSPRSQALPVLPEFLELQKRLEELDARQRAAEAHAAREGAAAAPAPSATGECTAPVSPAVRSGMNLSRRSQALHLHRRGETPEQIAASLAVSTGEIRLLLKVHRIAMEQVLRGRDAGLKSGADSADMLSSAGKANRRPVEAI